MKNSELETNRVNEESFSVRLDTDRKVMVLELQIPRVGDEPKTSILEFSGPATLRLLLLLLEIAGPGKSRNLWQWPDDDVNSWGS